MFFKVTVFSPVHFINDYFEIKKKNKILKRKMVFKIVFKIKTQQKIFIKK